MRPQPQAPIDNTGTRSCVCLPGVSCSAATWSQHSARGGRGVRGSQHGHTAPGVGAVREAAGAARAGKVFDRMSKGIREAPGKALIGELAAASGDRPEGAFGAHARIADPNTREVTPPPPDPPLVPPCHLSQRSLLGQDQHEDRARGPLVAGHRPAHTCKRLLPHDALQ